MNVDMTRICQEKFEKIKNALDESNFDLCTTMSSEMLRVSDYVDFPEGVFVGEFFESLFQNLDYTVKRYHIEDETMNDLKRQINELINKIKSSIPSKDKSEIYDLMTSVRAKMTRLQLESFRGEKAKRRPKGIPLPSGMSEEVVASVVQEDFE
jgi:hypothetical protein